jgi:hypothetical protein
MSSPDHLGRTGRKTGKKYDVREGIICPLENKERREEK